MLISKRTFHFAVIALLFYSFSASGQDYRKFSLGLYPGISFLPKSEKLNAAQRPQNIFGNYNPGLGLGVSLNYHLNQHFTVAEKLFFLHNSKTNQKLGIGGTQTVLRYNFIPRTKRISPFVEGGFNMSFVNIDRKESIEVITPDSNSNVIGPGIGVSKITYRNEAVKMRALPMPGFVLGAGIDFRLSEKVDLFLAYSQSYSFAKGQKDIKKYFPSNNSNLSYGMFSAGVTIKFMKPMKQLLATLKREQWEGDDQISVVGTMVYKKVPRSAKKKTHTIEMTEADTLFSQTKTSPQSMTFAFDDIYEGNYNFYLPKRNKRVIRADLEIIHDKKVKINDEYITLEMMETDFTENIISRDNNFSVVLREGFQHEVDVTVTAMSISGKINLVSPDTACSRFIVQLTDKMDSVIQQTTPQAECSYTFSNLQPGEYKVIFKSTDWSDPDREFSYKFTGSTPYITRQVNTVAPKPVFMVEGDVEPLDSNQTKTPPVDVLLVNEEGRIEKKQVPAEDGYFAFKDLPGENYSVAYEVKGSGKGTITYAIEDNDFLIRKSYVYTFDEKDQPTNQTPTKLKTQGKIEMKSGASSMDSVAVMVVDNKGRVVAKTKPAQDGSFSIDNLPAGQLKVLYQIPDTSVKAKLSYSFNNGNKVTRIKTKDKFATVEKVEKVDSTANALQAGDVMKYENLETGKTYGLDGEPKYPDGYGVQISAFVVPGNLKKMCDKLIKAGVKDAYIQVVETETGREENKLYRIVIGAHQNHDSLKEQMSILQEEGYNVVIREHLK